MKRRSAMVCVCSYLLSPKRPWTGCHLRRGQHATMKAAKKRRLCLRGRHEGSQGQGWSALRGLSLQAFHQHVSKSGLVHGMSVASHGRTQVRVRQRGHRGHRGHRWMGLRKPSGAQNLDLEHTIVDHGARVGMVTQVGAVSLICASLSCVRKDWRPKTSKVSCNACTLPSRWMNIPG